MSTPSVSHYECPSASSSTSSSFPVSLSSVEEPLQSIGSPGTSNGPYDSRNIVRSHRKMQKNDCALSFAFGKHYREVTTIDVLPDDVLLEIFGFCHLIENEYNRSTVWKWRLLVHVCHRWRQVIFAFPLRLNLQIFCTNGTPVTKMLDIWPTFPIIIGYEDVGKKPADEDDIIAALENTGRVCEVELSDLSGPQLGRISIVMQEPFPALTHLSLRSKDHNIPIFPSEFLGRSAPRLHRLFFYGIPFPALPVLLPSAGDLVTLSLRNIPQNGYISPEAMVAGLATLTRLRDLHIGFRSPNHRPDRIRLPPATRTILPALTSFFFWGLYEYLEDFAARIDAPRLDKINITYLNQLVDFEVPQLSGFIDRSEAFKRPLQCNVRFFHDKIFFSAVQPLHTGDKLDSVNFSTPHIVVRIICEGIDWQVSHLAQALSQIHVVSAYAVGLTIDSDSITPKPEDMVDIEWLQLLSQFSSIRTFFVPEKFAAHFSRALEDSAGEAVTTDVLPALDMLCLDGQPESVVHKFSSTRRDSGRPVTFVITKTEFKERLKSYEEEIRAVS